jgi:hypothetical protein
LKPPWPLVAAALALTVLEGESDTSEATCCAVLSISRFINPRLMAPVAAATCQQRRMKTSVGSGHGEHRRCCRSVVLGSAVGVTLLGPSQMARCCSSLSLLLQGRRPLRGCYVHTYTCPLANKSGIGYQDDNSERLGGTPVGQHGAADECMRGCGGLCCAMLSMSRCMTACDNRPCIWIYRTHRLVLPVVLTLLLMLSARFLTPCTTRLPCHVSDTR